MSDINFFSRLSNLFSGFISLFIADVEKNHPEIAYENSINNMTRKYLQLQKAAGAVIARREEIAGRADKLKRDLQLAVSQLEAAMNSNNDEMAVICIQRKNELQAALDETSLELTGASTDAEGIKTSLLQVQNEIRKLKSERDTMLAKMKSAEARLRINQQLDGLSVEADVQALERVREHIKGTVAQANLSQELRDTNLDVKLAKLGQSAGAINAQAELARMKAARQPQAAGAKTM